MAPVLNPSPLDRIELPMQYSRRHFLALGASTAAVATLAACGKGKPGPARPTAKAVTERTVPAGAKPDVVATYRAAPFELDLAGTVVSTWGYDGQAPGKPLRAKAGDVVEVTIDNGLTEATSIHWHGLAIVNSMDGVPGLTQPDIATGTSFTYRFAVPDPGTYWFHPHHGLQLDRGLYASFIIDDPNEPLAYDVEHIIVLDDWLDGVAGTPDDELIRIREMGASMGADMGDMANMPGMGGMSMASSPLLGGDAGDAMYPYHLINGHPLGDPLTLDPVPKAGDRVRLRIVNAGGDTAYRFAVGGHRLTITHTDGFPIKPIEVDAFVIGMGERYDVTFTAQSGAWPIVALAEGKDSRAAAVLRTRDAAVAPTPDLTTPLDEHDGQWLRYSSLFAAESVALAVPAKVRRVPIKLTGGMGASNWGFDNQPYASHQPINVEAGEWVTLAFENATTMWHPIHLHGHTPQLTSLAGGVRKDTANVLPGQTVEFTFPANNPGQWMVHCHNAYHLEFGMATTLSYIA